MRAADLSQMAEASAGILARGENFVRTGRLGEGRQILNLLRISRVFGAITAAEILAPTIRAAESALPPPQNQWRAV